MILFQTVATLQSSVALKSSLLIVPCNINVRAKREISRTRARARGEQRSLHWQAPVSARGEHARGGGEEALIKLRSKFFLRSLTVHGIPLAKNASWKLVR